MEESEAGSSNSRDSVERFSVEAARNRKAGALAPAFGFFADLLLLSLYVELLGMQGGIALEQKVLSDQFLEFG